MGWLKVQRQNSSSKHHPIDRWSLYRWSYIAWSLGLYLCLQSFSVHSCMNFCFLPAQTCQLVFGSVERELLSLPTHHGGLGAIVLTVHFSASFLSSSHIAAPLIDHLLRHCMSCGLDIYQQMYQCKHELRASCHSVLSLRQTSVVPLKLPQSVVHHVG